MRIVLTGGGTGGHLTPLEPVIATLRTQFAEQHTVLPRRVDRSHCTLYFLGVVTKEARDFFHTNDVRIISIPSGKLRRYASALTIVDLFFRLPIGILFALVHVWRIMPDVVISKGGYGSLPVVLAAVFYRIPILLHESDVVPGLANTLVARFASVIAVGMPQAPENLGRWQYKTVLTGTPVRTRYIQMSQSEAKERFEIPSSELVLLVMGGSQGAQQINEALLQVLPSLILDTAIIHVTGRQHFTTISTVAGELLASSPRQALYKPHEYLGEAMSAALIAADVVVARGGATTLAELSSLRKPALIIPLDGAANDHQRLNAQAYEAAGAVLVLDPRNMGKNLFEQNIKRLLTDQELRATLAKNIAALDHPYAATEIAKLTFKLAAGLAPIKKKEGVA